MSDSNANYSSPCGVIGLTRENEELLERIQSGLRPQEAWIGVHNVIQPYVTEPTPPRAKAYTGLERRAIGRVTVEQLAKRLGWKPAEIIFLANRNRIPGAYETDEGWAFDPRHARIWVDDVLKGVVGSLA